MRVGQGYDVHALVEGRPLILGGVPIPFELGLAGHSDADVLLHAVCDALLGAGGLGDLGRHYPDTDAAHAGRDSREFVRDVAGQLAAGGWRVGNVDATVVAERPKLGPYVAEMEANLAADLGVDPGRANVKATTTERLGWTGRGEGIAAMAVALLEPAR
ncbi:MAG: 2-C-methyl-D-erythritol 2,4-cyclodiphosphate synthase [Thiohalorhabdus sp.]|uniref:2-C-methyl-D-erythritol 2,4-cyclodiphosphate synthase n=1 Tax=Thiohalorhabdus sp. TaxID=3094134 RepID=UPI00397FE73E